MHTWLIRASRLSVLAWVAPWLLASTPGPLDSWEFRHGHPFYGVTRGPDRFVGVGYALATSPDGFNWTRHLWPARTVMNAIVWGGDRYVAVGEQGLTAVSGDGVNWAFHPSGRSRALSKVAWGNDLFVAVGATDGAGGSVLVSTDGATWSPPPSPVELSLQGVVFAHDRFVAFGPGDVVLTSTDGKVWRSGSTGTGTTISNVTWGNETFVAVSLDGPILRSPDAIVWEDSGLRPSLSDVTFAAGQFTAVGTETVMTSTDGHAWELRQYSLGRSTPMSLTYDGGVFVAVGGTLLGLLGSYDALEWEDGLPRPGLNAVAVGEHLMMAGGRAVMASPDGQDWGVTAEYITTLALTYGNGRFVAIEQGDGYVYLTSSADGRDWERCNLETPVVPVKVVFGHDRFVLVGDGLQDPGLWRARAVIGSSEDGHHWTGQQFNELALSSVAFVDDGFLAIGSEHVSGDGVTTPLVTRPISLFSKDGRSWETPGPLPVEFDQLAYGGGRYLGWTSGGNAVFVSTNRINWTRGTIPAPKLWRVTYGGGRFVALGDSVLSSRDGLRWTRHVPPPAGAYDIGYAGGTFFLVGPAGAILQSGFIQPDPPVLTGRWLGTDGYKLSWPAEVGQTYRVQACEDLGIAAWVELSRVTASGLEASFVDQTTPTPAQRFYRLDLP